MSAQALTTTDVTLFRGAVQEFPGVLLADEDNNLYLGASYSFDFLYDPAEAPLPGGDARSGAVIKRNAQGETVWAYLARYEDGTECTNACFGAVDLLAQRQDGAGIYVGLDLNAPVDLDNGPGSVLASGTTIVALDDAGNFERVYQFTSENSPVNVDLSGMASDNAGNLYIAGTFRVDMTIITGENTISLPQEGTTATLFNAFIGKISSSGSIEWIHGVPTGQLGNTKGGLAYRNGELHWTGRVVNGVDFDPSPVVLRTDLRSARGSFIARYRADDGRILSLFTFGDREDSGFVSDFKVGPDGKYYAIGANSDNFNLTADDATSPALTAPNWIASWRQDGSLRWFEGYPDARQVAIDVDAAGIVYISGSADDDLEIPGPDGPIFLNPGSREISFLQSVSHEGFLSDPVQLFSSSQTRGYDVEVSPSGTLYWTGTYRGELTDPNGQIVASEDIDIFLLELEGAVSVGTSNPDLSPDLTLFPNPTTDRLNVAGLNYSEGTIIDGFGRTVRQFGNGNISTLGLPSGAYFIRLRTEAGWATGRFLKR